MKRSSLIAPLFAAVLSVTGLTRSTVLSVPFAHAQGEAAEESRPASDFIMLQPGWETEFELKNNLKYSGRIAFSARIEGFERILVYDLDTMSLYPLIDGPGNNSYPSWSPDGKGMVFVSDRDGNKEIYWADFTGQNQRRLTTNKVVDDNPSFSPTGKRVVYYSETSGKGADADTNLFILEIENPKPLQITSFKKRNITPKWAPDGVKIAFTTSRFWPGWDICWFDVEARTERCPLGGNQGYFRPAWSPSGRYLAYSHGDVDQIDIGILDTQTKANKSFPIQWSGREYDAAFSPDGEVVVFVSEQAKRDVFNLYGFDMTRNQEITLVTSERVSIRYPSWGKKLDPSAAAAVPTATTAGTAPHDGGGLPPTAPTGYVPPYLRNQ